MHRILKLTQREEAQAVFLMGIRSISLVSKFALTLFIARFMGFEELGLYGLIVAGTFLIPSYTGLGIMHMKVRDAVTQNTKQIASTLEHYFKFLGLIYIVLIPVAFLIGSYTGNLVLSLAIIIAILFEHMNNDLYNLLLNRSKPFTANILHFLRTTLWMITFMVVAYFYEPFLSIEILLTGWIIGGALALLGFFLVTRDWYKAEPLKPQPLFSWLKTESKKARTMYFNNVVDCSGQYLNHFLVTFFLGLELTGVYVYFMQIIGAMSNLLRTGVIQNFRPKLVTAYKEKSPHFKALQRTCFKQTMMFAVLMAIAALPSMYWITNHFIDRPLAIEWFPIFAVNLTLFCVMMAVESNQVTLYSHHRDDLILKLSLLNITGLLILNVIFIPLFELWGAAYVLLFMACMIFTVQHMFIRSVLKHKKGSRLVQYFVCPMMMLMPNKVKIFLYNKLFDWEIDKSAKIGVSYMHVEKAKLGPHARIGHLNIIKNLELFEMGECSTIGNMNVVSALPLGSDIHFKDEKDRVQALVMGKHTDIVKNIFLDCNNIITIGDYTIIAGAGTSFFTHSINIERNQQESAPIRLGNHSMIGAHSVLTRGAVLPNFSVLAANSTLHKAFDQTHMLYSGVPAKPVKELKPDSLFFQRKVGFVD